MKKYRVKFWVSTLYPIERPAIRRIKAKTSKGYYVRFAGYSDFFVKNEEVIKEL